MNKKAVSIEVVVVLLVVLLGALVLFAFSGKLLSLFKGDSDVETCRISVLGQAQTKLGGKSPISLDCPRRRLKIFENKVELDDKKTQKYSFDKITQGEVNHILAEELRLCWYMMAEGKPNIFEQSFFFSDGKYYTCLICSEIQFDSKLSSNVYEGLDNYIQTKKIPNMDLTYYEYLIRSQRDLYTLGIVPWTQYSAWGYGTTGNIQERTFDAGSKYLIYFLAMKPVWLVGKSNIFTSAYYIGLGKEDKISEECSVLVN